MEGPWPTTCCKLGPAKATPAPLDSSAEVCTHRHVRSEQVLCNRQLPRRIADKLMRVSSLYSMAVQWLRNTLEETQAIVLYKQHQTEPKPIWVGLQPNSAGCRRQQRRSMASEAHSALHTPSAALHTCRSHKGCRTSQGTRSDSVTPSGCCINQSSDEWHMGPSLSSPLVCIHRPVSTCTCNVKPWHPHVCR